MHNFVTDVTGGGGGGGGGGGFMVIGTVNSATMEINYEDMCILQFGQSQ